MIRTTRTCWCLAALLPAMAGRPSGASEIRSRFVERIGSSEMPIESNRVLLSGVEPRHIRVQFGVFDNAAGPAPDGGFVGWNNGSIEPGFARADRLTRTPGRLDPFTFSNNINANGNPPLPDGDPFVSLTEISATLGIQNLEWGCGDNGMPLPMPLPSVYARNSFVSVFEITVMPRADVAAFVLTFQGDLFAADRWVVVGDPVPPDCDDPMNPVPGHVLYAPHPLAGTPFSETLLFVIPAPPAAILLAAMIPTGMRRRRFTA